MEMSERIKERRNSMGLTQEELGKKLGLQKSAIAKYENGRVENIKRNIIVNMAEILKCSPAYLMGWDTEDKKKLDSPEILTHYRELNALGRLEATKRVEELTHISKYCVSS